MGAAHGDETALEQLIVQGQKDKELRSKNNQAMNSHHVQEDPTQVFAGQLDPRYVNRGGFNRGQGFRGGYQRGGFGQNRENFMEDLETDHHKDQNTLWIRRPMQKQ